MRCLIVAAAVFTLLALTACQQKIDDQPVESKSQEMKAEISANNPPQESASLPTEPGRDKEQANQTGLTPPSAKCQVAPITKAEDVARFEKECKAKPECQLIKAEPCYCPPGVQCVCGGGKGPRCVAKNQDTAPNDPNAQ